MSLSCYIGHERFSACFIEAFIWSSVLRNYVPCKIFFWVIINSTLITTVFEFRFINSVRYFKMLAKIMIFSKCAITHQTINFLVVFFHVPIFCMTPQSGAIIEDFFTYFTLGLFKFMFRIHVQIKISFEFCFMITHVTVEKYLRPWCQFGTVGTL